MATTSTLWIIWAVATIGGATVLLVGMFYGGSVRGHLLIGRTTSGHHQIELACSACHTTAFGGEPVLQAACLSCHGNELKAAKDTHPASKFEDPRNADRLLKLAANECLTCHREHKAEITHAMGVTLPTDYCQLCHEDIGKERPSHVGLGFDTCASAGCHRFHDNRALYEDFLVKNAGQPEVKAKAVAKLRLAVNEPAGKATPLGLSQADAPAHKLADQAATQDWLATAHARAGVNCSGCHTPGRETGAAISAIWIEKPDHTVCATCHAPESKSFTQGKHGMRLAGGLKSSNAGLFGLFKGRPLTPMPTDLARLPMSAAAHGQEVGCTSCHSAHKFDVVAAQVEGCLGCHADTHSKAYVGSPHQKLWQAELAGGGAKGTGVSCATCHMPRQSIEDDSGADRVAANHNQNDNLRPSEKMVRGVCMDCHGLGFTLDSLADRGMVDHNFAGRPAARVPSIDWALKRVKERRAAQ